MASNFFWYELMTTDVPAAEAFYKTVVGWNSEPFPGSDIGYIVFKAGDRGVGGVMTVPEEAATMGARPPGSAISIRWMSTRRRQA